MSGVVSPFDRIQDSMFNVITSQFGYKAEWTPSTPDGSVNQTAKVCYKEPTKTFNLTTIDFQITDENMEYKEKDFLTLFRLANEANSEELVKIWFTKTDFREFYVRKVVKKYDGKTYIAKLEPKDD